MSFPIYPSYQDIELFWMKKVPSYWTLHRLGDICNFEQGKAHEPFVDPDGEYICVNSRFISTEGNSIKLCLENLTPAIQNDILMVMSDLPNGRALAKAYLVEDNKPYAVNQRVCRITAKAAHPKFLFYLLNRHPDLLKNDDGANQTHLSNSDYLKLKIFLPSTKEQSLISAFLDQETAKIDNLITEQKKLIELLKEKRQAVISTGVTKGLNPHAPMKDSGVEWLGEVPEHWSTSRLGHLIHILSGFAFPSTGFSLDENDTKLLRGANVGVSEIKWDDVVYWKRAENDGLDTYELDVGKIVIGMDRPLISTGIRISRITNNDIPSLLLQRVTAITTLGRICDDFLFRALTSGAFASSFESEMTGVSVPHISPSQISDFIVPIPPLTEQTTIVAFLDQETAKIDNLIQQAQKATTLLQERRTALISAAVTGKIDVRGFVKTVEKPVNA